MIPFLILLLIFIFIFLCARALVLWYWRVDRIVELLESIDGKLSAALEDDEKPLIVYPDKETSKAPGRGEEQRHGETLP